MLPTVSCPIGENQNFKYFWLELERLGLVRNWEQR